MTKYSDEFKLSVIRDYYQSPLGVRAIAAKYNLPSKNYVNKWEAQLKKKGLLPQDATKPVKSVGRSKDPYCATTQELPGKSSMKKRFNTLKPELHIMKVLNQSSRF